MIEEEPLDGSPISAPSEESGVVLAELVAQRPWGVGATLGLSLISAFAVIVVQALAAIPVIVYKMQSLPAGERADMEALAMHFASDGLVLSVSTFASGLVAVALVVLWSRLRSWSWQEYLSLQRFSPGAAMTSFASLAVILAASYFSLGEAEEQGADFMVTAYRSAGFLPLLYIALIVVAPVWEELFFRGFMHRGLAAGLGAKPAILICSASWALMHVQYNMVLIFWIFLVGLFWRGSRANRIDQSGDRTTRDHESGSSPRNGCGRSTVRRLNRAV